jgi:hypothetical protein
MKHAVCSKAYHYVYLLFIYLFHLLFFIIYLFFFYASCVERLKSSETCH